MRNVPLTQRALSGIKKQLSLYGEALTGKPRSQSRRFEIGIVVLIMIAVFVGFFLYAAKNIDGPQYLSDEIGYLSKAAGIAGSDIDGSSSWHAGYPLIIAFSFFAFDNPLDEWRGVLAINAMLMAISSGLLYYILRALFKKHKVWQLIIAVLVVATYPSWVLMSSFAFSTPAFILGLMVVLSLLLKSQLLSSPKWTTAFWVACGLLYWIHPVGIVAGVAAGIILLLSPAREHRYKAAVLAAAILVLTVGVYSMIVGPVINDALVPDGIVQTGHYGSLADRMARISTPDFWKEFPVIIFGASAHMLVATFGIIAASIPVLRTLFRKSGYRMLLKDNYLSVVAFLVLATFGALLLTGFSFASPNQGAAVNWLYGRYVEPFMFPLLAIGVLSVWKKAAFVVSAIVALVAGISLKVVVDGQNTDLANVNEVNALSLWPLKFVELVSYHWLFLIGAAGMVLVGGIGVWAGKKSSDLKYVALLPVVTVYIFTIVSQMAWHERVSQGAHSAPSDLYAMVTESYSPDNSCMGVSEKVSQYVSHKDKIRYETYKKYLFYLHDYSVQRMSLATWDKKCDGPYLSFDPEDAAPSDVIAVAWEYESGMYVMVKKSSLERLKRVDGLVDKYTKGLYVNTDNEECVIENCIRWTASSMRGATSVGTYRGEVLAAAKQQGMLLYGNYYRLPAGDYNIKFEYVGNPIGTRIRVVKNGAQKTLLDAELDKKSNQFTLSKDTSDVEVIVEADQTSVVDLVSYTITPDN